MESKNTYQVNHSVGSFHMLKPMNSIDVIRPGLPDQDQDPQAERHDDAQPLHHIQL